MNGLKQPFRVDYDYTKDNDFGTPVFDPAFHLAHPDVQLFLTQQCDDIRARIQTNPLLYSTNQTYCPMNEFRDYLVSKQNQFPVMNESEFDFRLHEFLTRPQYSPYLSQFRFERNTNDTGLVPFRCNFFFNSFPTTRSQRGEAYENRVLLWKEWSEFSAISIPPSLGKDGSSHPVDGFYDVWMKTQGVLLSSSMTSISFSLGVTLLILLMASQGDILVSVTGTLSLASSVSCTLGTMYLAGWSLGAVESVAATILCGVAVDYNIHLSIAFAEAKAPSQLGRVKLALQSLGISVFYGALTTFLASSFLLLCTISILNRFGQFMLMVISYSLFFSFFLQMSLLSVEYPCCYGCFDSLRRKQFVRKCSCSCAFLNLTATRVIYSTLWIGLIVLALVLGLTFSPREKKSQDLPSENIPSLGMYNYSTRLVDIPQREWVQIRGDESTGCATVGSRFSFFLFHSLGSAEEEDVSDSILVEFEGGGQSVCYSAQTCALSTPLFSTSVDTSRFQRINGKKEYFPYFPGATRPRVHVYLLYCTGDAFLGNGTIAYNEYVRVQHTGYRNAQSVLLWFFNQQQELAGRLPISLSGCGAGAIGAMAQASQFPNVSLIADSAVFTGEIQVVAHQVWNSTLNYFSLASLNATVELGRMLVLTTSYDWFQSLPGNNSVFRHRLEADVSSHPFVLQLPGDGHCVLRDYYYLSPEVLEMVRELYAGKKVENPLNRLYSKCTGETCKKDADLRS